MLRVKFLPAATLVLLLGSPPVTAIDPPPAAPGLSLDEAAALVRERVGGKVVRAETQEGARGRTYVFRVVSAEGRVQTVRVDAATGAFE
jgi:uncharacterized iron-regulated membrane protein